MERFDRKNKRKKIHTPPIFGSKGKKNKKSKIKKEMIHNKDGEQTQKMISPEDQDGY